MIQMSKSKVLIGAAAAVCAFAIRAQSETSATAPGNAPPASNSSTPTAGNSVETFFQVSPEVRNSSENTKMLPGVSSRSDRKTKSIGPAVYRCVWHVLDDAGVPMFFGHDPYIDPSIKGTYLIPSPKLPRERGLDKEFEQGVSGVDTTPASPAASTPASEPVPQKIPQSELEGVPLPTPRDDVHDSTP